MFLIDLRFKIVSMLFQSLYICDMASKSIPKPGQLSMSERYPRTISQDLHDSWLILKRYGDPVRICKEKNISRPIVDRAIEYGHVKDPHVTKKITAFFSERVDAERNSGKKLIQKAKK